MGRHSSAKLTVLLVMVFGVSFLHAGWGFVYGGDGDDWGVSGYETFEGNYVILGTTTFFGPGSTDIWLLRLDSTGNLIDSRTYGTVYEDTGYCLQPTSDGGFVFTGFKAEVGGGLWLFKLDAYGDSLWAQNHGGGSVKETSDGGYIIAPGALSLIKIDKYGDRLWRKAYSVGDEDHRYSCTGSSVAETHDGGYIVTGSSKQTYPYTELNDLFLLRTDSLGDTLWTRRFGGYHIDDGYCIQSTEDSCFLVVGRTISFGNGGSDLWLLKGYEIEYEEYKRGDTLWTRVYGGDYNDAGTWIEGTSDGGYVIGGWTESFNEGEKNRDFWLLKIDEQGDTFWTATYGGDEDDFCACVSQTADGGYLLTGYTYSFNATDKDLWVLKVDSLGRVGVEENPIAEDRTDCLLITSIGQKIVLSYENHPRGFHADIFDSSGRKVDEVHSDSPSGTLTWGERYGCCGCYGPGVYFIKERGYGKAARKVILVK
jgi:hypothetical protein